MKLLVTLIAFFFLTPPICLCAQNNDDDFLKALEAAFPSRERNEPSKSNDSNKSPSKIGQRTNDESFSKEMKELKAMAGSYSVVGYVTDGTATATDDLKSLRVVRGDNGQWSLFIGNQETTYSDKLNLERSPFEIDITITSDERKPTCLGIYERTGDLVRICFALPGNQSRPKDFASEKGSSCSLVELRAESMKPRLAAELADLEKLIKMREEELMKLKQKQVLLQSKLASMDEKVPSLVQLIDSIPAELRPNSKPNSLTEAKANKWLEKNIVGKRVVWNAGKKVTGGASPLSGIPPMRVNSIDVKFKEQKNGKFEAMIQMTSNFRPRNLEGGPDEPSAFGKSCRLKVSSDFGDGIKLVLSDEDSERLQEWPDDKDMQFEFTVASFFWYTVPLGDASSKVLGVHAQDIKLLNLSNAQTP